MSPHLLPEDLLAHAACMRRLARGLVLDEARADDVVQEAFTAVAERRPSRPQSVAGWLRGMVRNLARHSRREERRRRRREQLVARTEICPPTHAEMLERAELERVVVDCVLALPEPYRGTILARYFHDMSAAAIAARDGVPVATARTRLQRGLMRLRRALDEKHGGDGDRWRAVLFPLATAGLLTGSTGAAASAQGAAGAAAASAPAVASAPAGAGASAATKLILGGALVTQKTIAVAAAALLLGLGLGLGRFTARITPEEAKQRFQLVDAARVESLEARLQEAMRQAALEAGKAKKEVAALTSRLEALGADLENARTGAAGAAAPEPPPALAVAFGKFADLEALKDADWPELAAALREMNGLALESLDKLDKGEAVDPELTARLARVNAPLAKFALELMGKISTNAAWNGEWTHPLVASNLMGAMLEAAGAPLSAAQKAAIARLGNDYERQYDERQGGYSEETPVLKKMLDEFELKRACLQSMRSQLTPEQRDEVVPAMFQDRVQHDWLSTGASAFFLVKAKAYPSAELAREQFQRSTVASIDMTAEQAAALTPAFDAWYEAVKPLLEPQKRTHLSAPLEAVLQAGRAQEALLQRILELPGLDAKTRQALLSEQQWTLPQVFVNEG